MIRAIVKLRSVSPYSQSKHYEVPKKEGETSPDFEKRTWRERCHADASGMLFIPPMAFKNGIAQAAKRLGMKVPGRGTSTYSKHFEAGILVLNPMPLPIKKDEVQGEWLFVPSDGKRGGGKRVAKCFPLIPEWSGEVEFLILDGAITESVFRRHMEEFGRFIGIGRFSPRSNGYYGRFEVVSIKWISED